MNRVAFNLRLVKASDEAEVRDYYALDIRVDDRDLLEVVRETEAPYAAAEGHPDLAGKYEALPAFKVLEDLAAGKAEKVALYDCACGCFGCWPLLVRTSVRDETVVWSEFEQPHRGAQSRTSWWRYDQLGPFVFDRIRYEASLKKAESDLSTRERNSQ